ncbi:hypothetical protein CHELA1G11_11249 [Hyphomicrobiales bacterium]|nr:hypothetical protein CHELA1G11_11249 [Hyphomicrobiales bacterium]CAH1669091.1 hypothetical protein CHELA1G2_13060 [Hyphomicrobiales bacterium]
MTDTVTVPLSRPIQHEGVDLSSLTFRPATVGDLIEGDGIVGDTARLAAILASMAGIPIAEFRKVSAKDYNVIIDKTGDLWGNAP